MAPPAIYEAMSGEPMGDVGPWAAPPKVNGNPPKVAVLRPATPERRAEAKARGTAPFYVVAVAATLVSVDTSWRFFGDVLGITATYERAAMFAVLEMALIACGYAMRANTRRGDGPGPARWFAWALCVGSAYMAVALSGPVAGVARVALGPVLGLVALHLALGIEIRVVRRGPSGGVLATVGRELRERSLTLLGLADDKRDAAARIRDRAAERAARLATTGWRPFRRTRIKRALRAAKVTDVDGWGDSPVDRLLAHVSVFRNIDDLMTVSLPSPWRQSARRKAGRTPTVDTTDGAPVADSPSPTGRSAARRLSGRQGGRGVGSRRADRSGRQVAARPTDQSAPDSHNPAAVANARQLRERFGADLPSEHQIRKATGWSHDRAKSAIAAHVAGADLTPEETP